MRRFKNKAKNALALLLSAAMIAGTASVGWAAEEEVIVAVEDAETVGQSVTAEDSGIAQGAAVGGSEVSQSVTDGTGIVQSATVEGSGISQNVTGEAGISQDKTTGVSEDSQDGLSVEEIIVEEDLSAESVPGSGQLEAPEAESQPEEPGIGEDVETSGAEGQPEEPGDEEGVEGQPEEPGDEEGVEGQPEEPGTGEDIDASGAEGQPEESGSEESVETSGAEIQPEESGVEEDMETPEAESQAEGSGSEEDSELDLLDDEGAAAVAKEEDAYWINIWDGNNGVYELLPGESMDLFMELWKDGEENPLDPSAYKLTWKSSNEAVATISPNENRDGLESWQQSAVVTAAEKVDSSKENKAVITVKAVIGSVTKTEKLDIYVHDGIWVITPRDDYGIQLYPGQTWKSGKPVMTYYELGKDPKVKNNIKFKWVYNPDKKGNDTYGKKEPVSLKREKNGSLTVTAGEFNGKYGERNHIDLVASDPKDPDFQISNGFEFEVLYFEEHCLDNNIEGALYTGGSATFSVNPDWVDERLMKSNPTVTWEVFEYDEASDKNKLSKNATIKAVSGKKYNAKGTFKKPGSYAVCATLKINGKTAGKVWTDNFEVRNESKEYRQWYASDLIPGYEIRLEEQSRYYVDNAKNPDREYVLQYKNVKSSNPHVVSVRTENYGEQRTILRAENNGTATITGSMIWTEDSGKKHTESFKVTLTVTKTVYRAELYVKSGGDRMVPKDTRQLVLNVWKEDADGSKNLAAKDYTVKWKNYDKNVLKISSKGKVTAKKYGDCNVIAEITVKKSGYKLQAECWLGVMDGYFDMVPKSIGKDLYPGDVVSLETPTVYWYEQGKKPVVRKDVRFEWWLNPDENGTWNDLDTDIYSLKFDKDHNIKSITVNRMPTDEEYAAGKNNLHIEVRAINTEEGFEMAGEWFDFWVNHASCWIESDDQQNFTGGQQKLTCNEDFRGNSKNLKIKWNIREQFWDDEAGDYVDAAKGSEASISAKGNGQTATLKFIKAQNGNGRVIVSAKALYKGTEIGSTEEREYYFRDPSKNWYCFPVIYKGEEYVLNDKVAYRIDNETYPNGQTFPVTGIKNAKIVQQEAEDSSKKNKVLKLTKKANGDIVLEGLNPGRALVRGEFTAKVGKKTVKETHEEWYYVQPLTYYWELGTEKGETHNVLPGSSLQFTMTPYKETAAGTSRVDKSKYACTWELREGADIADLSKNGKLKVHKNAEEGRYINVYVKFWLKSDKNAWGESNYDLWVSNSYYDIDVSNIVVRKGKTVTVNPVLKWYSKDYPKGYTEKGVSFTYKADPSDISRIQVKGNKVTGLMTGTQNLFISTEKNGQRIEEACTVTVNP